MTHKEWQQKYLGRQSPEYKTWRASVLVRDGYACVVCGEVGKQLHVHHIKGYSDYEDLRYDIDNGVTLCMNCHHATHQ